MNAATAFDSIIDFGDINHLKVFLANDAALLAKVHEGLEKAKDIVDDAGQYALLNLARNQIGANGVAVLACSLEINTTLQMLKTYIFLLF